MPLFKHEPYAAPVLFQNGHVATIAGHLFRNPFFIYDQELEWTTPDGDYLIVHSSMEGKAKLIVLLHGLEGNSHRAYMKGMANKGKQLGYDILALNFRSCTGKMNLLPRFYHSGDTGDLRFIIEKVIADFNYKEIVLIGFSLGGNVLLKYLSEESNELPGEIRTAIAVSAPVDLGSSALEIERLQNRLYLNRFLRSLKRKVQSKMLAFPDAANWQRGLKAKTFHEFDDAVTAPLHGFNNVLHYYTNASSLSGLNKISVPALLLSARNDSFLSEKCFPEDADVKKSNIYYSYPAKGGHVGFPRHINLRETFPEYILPFWLKYVEDFR